MTSNIGDRVQRKVAAVLHRTTQLSPCRHYEKTKSKILYLNSRINHRELANTEVFVHYCQYLKRSGGNPLTSTTVYH